MSDEYDSPWKEILGVYFAEFLAFLFPDIHREIDWSRGFESLDQELPKIVRDAETGKRFVDKLVKVWRLDGQEQIVFIHVELQADYDADFPYRMVVYHYRIFDRYQQPVVSLAILGDDRPRWRPSSYSHKLWGCELDFRFPMVKLWDYNKRWSELEVSDSPFAKAVMAHLKARATRKDPEGRFRWKLRLFRHLFEGGLQRRDIVQLLRFVDWLLSLPPELEQRFRDEVTQLETEKKMRYVTSFERLARAEGMQLVIKRLLMRRFDSLPEWAEERLQQASTEELESWTDRVIDAESLEQVFAAS